MEQDRNMMIQTIQALQSGALKPLDAMGKTIFWQIRDGKYHCEYEGLRHLIFDHEQWLEFQETQGGLHWVEGKSYSEHSEDTEPSIQTETNGITSEENETSDEPVIEPQELTKEQLHKLELEAKMAAIREQEEKDLLVKQNMDNWTKWNYPGNEFTL